MFALCLLLEKKVMTSSDPMVTYSHPKVIYSYPKVTYSDPKVTHSEPHLAITWVKLNFLVGGGDGGGRWQPTLM